MASARSDRPGLGGALGLTAAWTLALLVAPVAGGLVHDLRPVLAVGLIAGLSVAYGRALTRLLAPPPVVARHLVCVVVGFCGLSLVHLGATVALNRGATAALVVDVVGAALATWFVRRAESSDTGEPAEVQTLSLQVGVLLACACLTTLWARETITAVAHAEATGTFPAWQDYFLHASEVAYMRDYPAFHGQSQYLTAIPQPLYHRGSYTMPALLSALAGTPTLGAATAFWMPAGLLLCMLAVYTWGAALAAPIGGLAAMAAVFLVPDASAYGFENRFLSFHWLLQMAAGSSFALALTVTGLTLVVTAAPARLLRMLVAAMGLAVAGAAFRVHVSLLSALAVLVLAPLTLRTRLTGRMIAGLAVAAALAAGVLIWMETLTLAPHILSGGNTPSVFFLSIHSQASALPTPFTPWTAGRSEFVKFAVGYPMMLVAGCGLWLAALVAAWALGGLRRLGDRVAAVPVALLLAHMTVIRLVPTPAHGDPTDFGHRPFVLVYLVVAVTGAVGLVALARAWADRRLGGTATVTTAIVVASLVGLVAPWRDGAGIQQRWTPAYATIPVSSATMAASAFVRDHSSPGDQILAASEDPLAVFVALTERRAYLSRKSLYDSLGPASAEPAAARAAEHATIAHVTTFDALRAFGVRTGVAWYLADTAATAAWPVALTQRSVFAAGALRVYDLR